MASPQLGTLWNPYGDGIPGMSQKLWSQPGGPGTIVYPQMKDSAAGEFEPPMTPVGMYDFGCGHPMNCPAVFKVWDDDTQTEVALICCPACTYIQQIISPYSAYLDYIENPIPIA